MTYTIFGIKSVPSSLSYHIVKNIIFHLKELFLCYSLKEIQYRKGHTVIDHSERHNF